MAEPAEGSPVALDEGPRGSDEVGRLAALRRYDVLDTAPEQVFEDLVELAALTCETSMAAISLVDEHRQWFKARRNIGIGETPRGWAFCAYTILSTQVFEVPDTAADDRFVTNPLVTGDPAVRFYAAAPIITRDGYALGTICVLDTIPRSLSGPMRRALRAIARQVMDELDLRQALADRRAGRKLFGALVRQASDVVGVIAADGTVRYASPNVEKVTGYGPDQLFGTNFLDLVHRDDLDEAKVSFARTLSAPGVPQSASTRLRARNGEWLHLKVVTTNLIDDAAIGGIVFNITDVTDQVEMTMALEESEQRFRRLVQHSTDIITVVNEAGLLDYISPAVARVLGYDAVELLGRPVADFVGRSQKAVLEGVIGVEAGADIPEPIEVRFRHADGRWLWFELTGTNLLSDPAVAGIVVNARNITERKQYEERLLHHAVHDPLTGLPNRALLDDRLHQALALRARNGTPVAVLFIDLDRFKLVNDSAGHVVGDRLLVEVARLIEDAVRGGDTVARFGGDEFVVVCNSCSMELAVELATRIRDRLLLPLTIADATFFVDVSIGVAVADGGDPSDMLRDADSAMYAAKERGRGRIEVFEATLRTRASRRLQLTAALHHALRDDEFFVLYQPIVDLTEGRCVGAEALVRWHHPQLGLVHPDDFIAFAEDCGLIVDIGALVLRDVATHAARWSAKQGEFYVSVNVGSRQLEEPDFAATVRATLSAVGAPPASIVLELTETVLMQEGESTRANLDELRSAGVRVAIDDFGTGYSSLAYLKRLPVQMLKIDGSFIAGLGQDSSDAAIVQAVTTLGGSLGLIVVAEHVETERQRTELEKLGCVTAQGYLFCQPVPSERIDELLGESL